MQFSTSLALANTIHVVGPGDSVDSLARKYGVSKKDIARANKISSEALLRDGRKLSIPEAPKGLTKPEAMHVPVHICGDRVALRMGPSKAHRQAGMFDHGAAMTQTAKAGEWSQVTKPDGKNAWVKTIYLSSLSVTSCKVAREHPGATAKRLAVGVVASAGSATRRRISSVRRVASHRTRDGHRRRGYTRVARRHHSRPEVDAPEADSEVIRTAYAYRGTPYRFGGSSRNGIDCSGLTSKVYSKHGVSLPHSAREQFHKGTSVNKKSMKEGDLVFFHTTRRGISHVGIYAGKGKFVHASSGGGRVRVDSLNDGYYASRFRGARRVK
jgi:cell wall-associated NlpC family hydrolase